MIRLNQMGEFEEVRDIDIHGNAIAKPIMNVDNHESSNIDNEKSLLDKINKREVIDMQAARERQKNFDMEVKAIRQAETNKRNYEKQVLRDQELYKNYDDLRDDYLEARFSYNKEKENPTYQKSSHLGWSHLDPSRDYEIFEKGLKYGLNESGREVITHGHLSSLNAAQQERYLTEEEALDVRQGISTGIDKRQSETNMQGMGDFWSDLRDSAFKDVKEKADEYLSYDNIKDEAQKLIAQQLNQGGQVQTMPDGSQVMVMPSGQQFMMPMQSSINTKTLLIAGGGIAGLLILLTLLKR